MGRDETRDGDQCKLAKEPSKSRLSEVEHAPSSGDIVQRPGHPFASSFFLSSFFCWCSSWLQEQAVTFLGQGVTSIFFFTPRKARMKSGGGKAAAGLVPLLLLSLVLAVQLVGAQQQQQRTAEACAQDLTV